MPNRDKLHLNDGTFEETPPAARPPLELESGPVQGATSSLHGPSGATEVELESGPVQGATFSLYGPSDTTEVFYRTIDGLADECIERWPDLPALIDQLRRAGSSRRRLRALARNGFDGSPASYAVLEGARRLAAYTSSLEGFLGSLRLRDRFNRTLTFSLEQYHLAMLEVELINRANRPAFERCANRLALLPHCLHDLSLECQSRPRGLDNVCSACSSRCYLNAVSRLLRKFRIRPYIWMSADLRKMLKEEGRKPGGLGVLGIACVPELIAGMSRCARAGVPVLGLSLDANRCARWLGTFHSNTVTLARLEALVG